ncbi:uncharacterized protein LOC143610103 [Bidens hawaiensis]|uniref:uncharacterized protein LOC143610103 n=1 Tax=Bidens hawaiensis TaxID=980011 RepID=UPI00404A0BE3
MLKAKHETSVSLSPPQLMEEQQEQEDDDEQQLQQTPTSPFWIQTTTTNHHISSMFFNSFVLIIFLLLLAIISMVFIIPYLISLSSNVFRPSLVKRSWDSINLILVFIALVFGLISRNINNDQRLNLDHNLDHGFDQKLNLDHNLDHGYVKRLNLDDGYVERLILDNVYDQSELEMITGAPNVYGLRRQRTSISYPDLRELSPPLNHRAGDPWRFSDDTHIDYYHVLESGRNLLRQRNRRERGGGSGMGPEIKSSLEKKGGKGEVEKRRARSSELGRILSPVVGPLRDAALSSPVLSLNERKTTDDNVGKDFFTSFHHKKKKKRLRDRSVDNLGALLHQSQPVASIESNPRVMTTESGAEEHRRNKSTSVALPPPPPPPPSRTKNYARQVTITRVAPFVTDKPGASLMMTAFTSIDDSSSGGESPMKQIPPPPPLPPFKMPDWKFAVEGDFVRLQSTLSSRSASPDGDEARSPSSDVDMTTETGLLFPGPDVDTKADSFIARFRAGLKLEKSERMSKLGPGPGSGPSDI